MRLITLYLISLSLIIAQNTIQNQMDDVDLTSGNKTIIRNGLEHRLSDVIEVNGQRTLYDTIAVAFVNDTDAFNLGIGQAVYRSAADTASFHVNTLSSHAELIAIGASWAETGKGLWNVWQVKNISETGSYLVPMTGAGLLENDIEWTISAADTGMDGSPNGQFQWLNLESAGLIFVPRYFAVGHSMDASGLPRMFMDAGGHNFNPGNGAFHERAKTYLAAWWPPNWYYWGFSNLGIYSEYVTKVVVRYILPPQRIGITKTIPNHIANNPNMDLTIEAFVFTSICDSSTANLLYSINGGKPESLEMLRFASSTNGSTDSFRVTLPDILVAGDVVSYSIYAESCGTIGQSPEVGFQVIIGPSTERVLFLADGANSYMIDRYQDAFAGALFEDEIYYWNADDYNGLDPYLLNHQFDVIIHVGFGTEFSPDPRDKTDNEFVLQMREGASYFLIDSDYFYAHGTDGKFYPGEFAYKYLAVDSAVSDPSGNPFPSIFNVNANTDAYLAEFFYEDMTIDLATINVDNWSDFLFARSGYENLLYSDSSQIHGMYAATGTHFLLYKTLMYHSGILFGFQISAADNFLEFFPELVNLHLWTGIEDDDEKRADRLILFANYPNPFNPTTTIEYYLPKAGEVTLEVFNVLGQKVVTLTDGLKSAGKQTVVWDATDMRGNAVASGTYFYQLRSGGKVESRRMVLLK
jgi:hypothetical protein